MSLDSITTPLLMWNMEAQTCLRRHVHTTPTDMKTPNLEIPPTQTQHRCGNTQLTWLRMASRRAAGLEAISIACRISWGHKGMRNRWVVEQ